MCKPQIRTRVVLDEAEIRRRINRPKRPSLAERYAQATDSAARERFYRGDTEPRTEAPARDRPRAPAKVWITRPILKARGWTDAAIRDFLPAPENTYSNPHVKGRNRMQLWSARTVARTEAMPAFGRWLRGSMSRRRMTLDDLVDSIDDTAFLRRLHRANAAIESARRALR